MRLVLRENSQPRPRPPQKKKTARPLPRVRRLLRPSPGRTNTPRDRRQGREGLPRGARGNIGREEGGEEALHARPQLPLPLFFLFLFLFFFFFFFFLFLFFLFFLSRLGAARSPLLLSGRRRTGGRRKILSCRRRRRLSLLGGAPPRPEGARRFRRGPPVAAAAEIPTFRHRRPQEPQRRRRRVRPRAGIFLERFELFFLFSVLRRPERDGGDEAPVRVAAVGGGAAALGSGGDGGRRRRSTSIDGGGGGDGPEAPSRVPTFCRDREAERQGRRREGAGREGLGGEGRPRERCCRCRRRDEHGEAGGENAGGGGGKRPFAPISFAAAGASSFPGRRRDAPRAYARGGEGSRRRGAPARERGVEAPDGRRRGNWQRRRRERLCAAAGGEGGGGGDSENRGRKAAHSRRRQRRPDPLLPRLGHGPGFGRGPGRRARSLEKKKEKGKV